MVPVPSTPMRTFEHGDDVLAAPEAACTSGAGEAPTP